MHQRVKRRGGGSVRAGAPPTGTFPRCRWGTARYWIRPGGRSASAGWPRCRWPRPPASPPSSARSWSSGTPSRTPGPGCSSRSSTGGGGGGGRQTLREHFTTRVKINVVSCDLGSTPCGGTWEFARWSTVRNKDNAVFRTPQARLE